METAVRVEVALVGGGFSGVYCARELAKAWGKECWGRVGLISDENFMLFQPLLAEVAGSALSPRHVVNPLRRLCRNARVLRGAVRDIDLDRRLITLDAGAFTRNASIEYEHLVLALGSTVNLARVPGMAEHAFLMKNVGDALALRATVIDRMEEAALLAGEPTRRRLLTFVVVGGGYSGVETAGQLRDLLEDLWRFYPSLADTPPRVILVHSGDRLLPTMGERLARYTEATLRKRGVEVILNTRVRAVTASTVHLGEGAPIESHTVISTVGNAPHPVLAALSDRYGLLTDHGRLVTDPFLRVPGPADVWAAGDCAAVPLPSGGNAPATAQFAMRQGRCLGANLAATIAGREPRRFAFKGLGEVASIGHHRAVAEIFGMKFHGFLAWWVWRTIYLLKLPGLERKLRVMMEWSLDLFFPREHSVFRPTPSSVLKEMHLEPGDVVFQSGEPAFSFYVIRSGRIRILDEGGLVKSLGPGEHFGERALLDDRVWRFTAVADGPCTLTAVKAETFEAFAAASSAFRSTLQQTAGQYLPRRQLEELITRVRASADGARAADLMTRNPVCLQPSLPVDQAIEVVRKHGYNSYPIVDDQGRPVRLFTQEDMYEAFRLRVSRLADCLEKDPVRPVPTVGMDTPLAELIETFYRSGNRKLLVVNEQGSLEGIVTLIDILAARSADGSPARRPMEDPGPGSDGRSNSV